MGNKIVEGVKVANVTHISYKKTIFLELLSSENEVLKVGNTESR